MCPKIFQIKHPKALGRIYFSTSNLHLRPLDPKNKIKDFDWVMFENRVGSKKTKFRSGCELTSLGCVGCRTTSSICSFGCPLGSIPEINQVLDFEMQKFQSFVLNSHDHGGSYQFQKAVLELFERFRNCFQVPVPTWNYFTFREKQFQFLINVGTETIQF